MRTGLKRALEVLLARGGPALAARSLRQGGVVVLAYHNVVPARSAPAGERSLHLSFDDFRQQLDLVQRWQLIADIALLSAAPHDAPTRVVITFDDAYRGAVALALPELRDRGLPATMFVAPGRLGGHQFWWDGLATDGTMPSNIRQHALEALRGNEEDVRLWARTAGLPVHEVPELWCSATTEELHAAAYFGLTVGSHSWSHPNMARLAPAELDRELEAAHDWLVSHFPGAYVPWLAYPYGRFTRGICDAARDRGLAGGLRIDGGWARLPLVDPLAAPRLNIPAGLSADGFTLRISGLLGA
jgi:peptidoglycan/xylan/chitin deacetylase (PgdA/CDA1 family)